MSFKDKTKAKLYMAKMAAKNPEFVYTCHQPMGRYEFLVNDNADKKEKLNAD